MSSTSKGIVLNNESSPWAVTCPDHGRVFLTHSEYVEQLSDAMALWYCPCGLQSEWDDENYEDHANGVG